MLNSKRIKVISFDVTGTLIVHRDPIMDTYANAAAWARLPNPPTASELKPAFKQAYKETLMEHPCFRNHPELYSSRNWWLKTVKRAVELTGRTGYSDMEFNRFFRRVYQVYGSLRGYEVLEDTLPLLSWLHQRDPSLVLGITTNTPARTVETVLPMVGLHEHFKFFVCCQDVGVEKPGKEIFQAAYEEASFWVKALHDDSLDPSEVLHVGDSLAADYCGSKAFGFQSLYLDRSANAKVTRYQDWLTAPDFPGKSEETIRAATISNLHGIREALD
jgi:putative hydrolase of the HAD superfamily